MGNRRLGTKRLEAALDNLLEHATLNGLNGSPFTIKGPDRVYLEEYFEKRPCLNADIESATENTREVANVSFEVLGSGASSDDVTFSATTAGIQLQPDQGDNKSVIILPHLDTNQTAWTGTKWGTENQVQWECMIRTGPAITTVGYWAGLKLTNTDVYATDADQAYFLFGTDDDSGALTTNANLHFVYSVGNTDYISDLGITVAADTTYRLGITIDSNRKASAWVNGVQYSLTAADTAGGVATGTGTQKSLALTNDVDLIPYVGVICRAGSIDRELFLMYEKMSRIAFE